MLIGVRDDMSIKLWNWDKEFKCIQVFEGHSHYVRSAAYASPSKYLSRRSLVFRETRKNRRLETCPSSKSIVDYDNADFECR